MSVKINSNWGQNLSNDLKDALPVTGYKSVEGKANWSQNLSNDLEDALAESISGTVFSNVAFHAFSQRLASGKVGRPRMVLANGRMLRSSSSYFRALLSGGFVESKETVDAASLAASTEDYDYESDSDLEDCDSDDVKEKAWTSSIEDANGVKHEANEADAEKSSVGLTSGPALNLNTVKIVPMRSVAAQTLECLLFYVYASKVYFLPLRSRGLKIRREAEDLHRATNPGRPICSCKSMYRLADETGFYELMCEAEERLMSELTLGNILDELFSRFSSRYEIILKKQVKLLCNRFWTDAVRESLRPKIDSIARGEMPHASAALTLLLLEIPLIIRAHLSPVKQSEGANVKFPNPPPSTAAVGPQ